MRASRVLCRGIDGAAWTLAGLGAIELLSSTLGRSAVDRLGQVAVDTGPVPLVEETVRLLKTADKPVIRLAAVAGVTAAGGLAAALAPRRAALLGHRAGPAVRCAAGPLPGPRAAAATGIVALAASRWHLRRLRDRHDQRADRPLHVARPLPPAVDGAEGWGHPTPLLTPVDRFYVTDVAMRPPLIEPSTWRLDVTTPVGSASQTLADLSALGLREVDATLACVHNRLGWDRLGTQRWTGLPLDELFELLRVPLPEERATVDLLLTAVDGWSQIIPGEVVAARHPWLVLGMGGRPLSAAHGAPARLITPGVVGQYGAIKWLRRLDVVPQRSRSSTWQRRGWPRDTVSVLPSSRIDLPRSGVVVAAGAIDVMGVAWAPGAADAGVAEVALRMDDGPWRPVELAREVSPHAWRRWRARVTLDAGYHRIQAKTTGRDGAEQDGVVRPPFPLGQSGWHTISVRAR